MGLTIDSKIGAKEPIPKMKTLKAESKLSDLKKHIETAFNNAISNGRDQITGDWLQLQIDIFNKKFNC
jgi:hypothetical protein